MIYIGQAARANGYPRRETEVILIEDRDYNAKTPDEQFASDGRALAKMLQTKLPSGTIDRMMLILLNKEIESYQQSGDFAKAGTFIAAADVYRERCKKR